MKQRVAILSAVLAVAGCATLGRIRFQAPEVRLAEVQIMGLGFSGGTLNLVLDVHNPNGYEIRTQRLTADLELEETHFGDVALERNVRLAPEANTLVDVPLRFTWEGVGAGARALLGMGSVQYRMRGTLHAETPMGERPVSLSRGGTVALRDLVR
jgi:LEA14-like dessication related protein